MCDSSVPDTLITLHVTGTHTHTHTENKGESEGMKELDRQAQPERGVEERI